LAGPEKLGGGSQKCIEAIAFIIGNDNNAASAVIRYFDNFTAEAAVLAHPFLPDPETHNYRSWPI
jgi:hypothetical protein